MASQSDNGWTPYDSDMIAKIEKGFQKGQKKIKVDDERYIDIPR